MTHNNNYRRHQRQSASEFSMWCYLLTCLFRVLPASVAFCLLLNYSTKCCVVTASSSSSSSNTNPGKSTTPTMLIPLHRQLLLEYPPSQKEEDNLLRGDNKNIFYNDNPYFNSHRKEAETHMNDWWVRLGEKPEVGYLSDDIPATRRAHSSTVYKTQNDAGKRNEYMIMSGGFTFDDWMTFPVWSYDMTKAYETGTGTWVHLYDSTSDVNYDEEVCNNSTVISSRKTDEVPEDEDGGNEDEDEDEDEDGDGDGGNEDTDLWENASNCPPQSRMGHMSAVHNNFLYVFGGLLYDKRHGVFYMEDEPYIYRLPLQKNNGNTTNTDEALSSTNRVWQRILPRIQAPEDSTASVTKLQKEINRGEVRGGYWENGKKMIIYGGMHVRDTSIPNTDLLKQTDVTLGDVWAYDFETDTWDQMAPSPRIPDLYFDDINAPSPRTSHAACIVGDNLIVSGGLMKIDSSKWDGSTIWEQNNDVWIFNLNTRTWKERDMMQRLGRSYHSLVGWEDPEGNGPIVAMFGGYKTVNDPLSSVPRPITYVFDDTLVSFPSQISPFWLKAIQQVMYRFPTCTNRLEHSAVISENTEMFVWGGRFESTDDIDGIWSLNLNTTTYLVADGDDQNNEAFDELYLLVTTMMFMSIIFTYMCGVLSRQASESEQDGNNLHLGDVATQFPGLVIDSPGSSGGIFGNRNGLNQDIIDTLPLKTYHNTDEEGSSSDDTDGENRKSNESREQESSQPPLGRTLNANGNTDDTTTSGEMADTLSDLNADVFDDDEDCCPICLVEYKEGDEIRCLPCGHEFHKTCVDSWLGNQASCPSCRHSLQDLSSLTSQGNSAFSWHSISNLTSSQPSSNNNTTTTTNENQDNTENSADATARSPTAADEETIQAGPSTISQRPSLSRILHNIANRRRGFRLGISSRMSNASLDSNGTDGPPIEIVDSLEDTSDDLALSYSSSLEMTEEVSPRRLVEDNSNDLPLHGQSRRMRVGDRNSRRSRTRRNGGRRRVGGNTSPLNDPLQPTLTGSMV